MVAAAARYGERVKDFLRAELPHAWHEAYAAMTPGRESNILVIARGTFDFIYDDISADGDAETRVVAAIGTSAPEPRKRDDSRLQGWLGPTGESFGTAWDKGHFVAHSVGGAVRGWELNVFIQRRDLNRGWSAAGRRYRAVERYCAAHPGVLCWTRPIYTDGSAFPLQIELGVLEADDELWVETFDNWYAEGEFHQWLHRRTRRI